MKEIKLNRNNRYLLICSIIYAIFIIIGERYKKINSWKIIKTNIPFAILKTIVISAIIYAILVLVKKIYKKIRDSNKKKEKFKKLKKAVDNTIYIRYTEYRSDEHKIIKHT